MLRRGREGLGVQGQLPEGGSEESSLRIDPQHLIGHLGHHDAATLPKRVPGIFKYNNTDDRGKQSSIYVCFKCVPWYYVI